MTRPTLQNKLENASVYRELPMDSRGEAFLNELGIVIGHFPPCLKLVEVTSLNVIYRGIGIRNIRGGTEFYCPELLPHPFTVRKPGLTVAPRIEGRRSSTCCLFTDLLDYLSYLTFLDMHGTPIPEGDCIFMSSIRHFIEMVPYCKHYQHVLCYFPFSQAGKVMFETIRRCANRSSKDCSYQYGSAVTLWSYVKQNR